MMRMDIQKGPQIVLSFVPELFLLGWFENADDKKHKHVIIHLLAAASVSLATLRKEPHVPTLREWDSKVYYLCLMSKLSAHRPVLSGSLGAMDKF